MQIFIQSRSFSLTQALRRHVEQKIKAALERRADDIMRINVRLSDINGPHGGIDKRCFVHVVVPHQADIIIEETQNNLYSAVHSACARARSVLSRKLSRHKFKKRSSSAPFHEIMLMSAS